MKPSRPFVTTVLVLILIGVQFYAGGLSGQPDATSLIELGARKPNSGFPQDPWRLLASVFLHANWMHLTTNAILIAMWGACLERLLGHLEVLTLFLLAGFWGSLFSDVYGPDALAMGASGSVMGFVMAVLVLAIVAPEWPRWGEGEARRWLITSIAAIALNAASAIGFATFVQGARLDHWAHGGGAMCGVVVGLAVALAAEPRRRMAFWSLAGAQAAAAAVVLTVRGGNPFG